MKVLLDTCVLFPTVMREVLLAAARTGAFEPIWSARILEEWARAARKLGPSGQMQAEAEIALLRAGWSKAERPAAPGREAALWLPDPADVHVLAVAIEAGADAICTLNAKDFPRGTLSDWEIQRLDPDALALSVWQVHGSAMEAACAQILAQAQQMSGTEWTMRGLLKKARLPRLAKALA